MATIQGVDPNIPREAQRIVGAYLEIVEAHVASGAHAAPLGDLPYPRQTIRDAFRTSTRTLLATGQLTSDLRDYLEGAFATLADYVDDECLRLLREFAEAGEAYAADGRSARDKAMTAAWQRMREEGRLAGQLARAMSDEAERLRAEFRSWQAPDPSDPDAPGQAHTQGETRNEVGP